MSSLRAGGEPSGALAFFKLQSCRDPHPGSRSPRGWAVGGGTSRGWGKGCCGDVARTWVGEGSAGGGKRTEPDEGGNVAGGGHGTPQGGGGGARGSWA